MTSNEKGDVDSCSEKVTVGDDGVPERCAWVRPQAGASCGEDSRSEFKHRQHYPFFELRSSGVSSTL
jgi:hypothetical protein